MKLLGFCAYESIRLNGAGLDDCCTRMIVPVAMLSTSYPLSVKKVWIFFTALMELALSHLVNIAFFCQSTLFEAPGGNA